MRSWWGSFAILANPECIFGVLFRKSFVMTILRGFPKMHPKCCAVSTLETSREDIEAYIEGVGQNDDPRWGRVCSQGVVRVT